MNVRVRIYKFVLHEEIEKYEAMGYRFANFIQGHHGQYSVIMEKVTDENRKQTSDGSAKTRNR